MSKSRAIWIGVSALAIILLALASWKLVIAPAGELRGKLRQARGLATQLGDRVDAMNASEVRLRELGSTMLAGDPDLLAHRLRAGLSQLATQAGLGEVVVTSTPPRGVENPAARVRMTGGFRELRQRLRKTPDFYVVRGRVQGQGPLDAATATLALLESQPWVHRIEGVTIRPIGSERANVELKADFAIAMAPDLAPRDASPKAPEIEPASAESLAAMALITKRGLFRVPPEAPKPAEVVKQPDPAPTPKPKPPPYGNWRLAGVMGGNRVEAVVVHTANGKSRLLGVGDQVLGATFEEGSGERAVFRIGDKRYEVLLGKSLADRRELK